MMSRKVKQQVNSAVNELDMNLANNYKDLAHKALKELDELVTKLNEEGQLKEKDYTKLRDKVFYPQIGVGKRLDGGRRRVKKFMEFF